MIFNFILQTLFSNKDHFSCSVTACCPGIQVSYIRYKDIQHFSVVIPVRHYANEHLSKHT